ncbi:MAG: putative basic amino acid antiporter YfcC [Arenimonas sp.]|uniref:putative basic amino acid antiporter YfcC n=1 Tax=Arenimonas sp. TaxID=1872635 RepID=UPI0025C22943|nr:putative basic amino acid antiporter YfcC [Arenimonas sp.]MBW8366675.1 putative basic amino acid antiporter YfcC [Arenimonas sp.]
MTTSDPTTAPKGVDTLLILLAIALLAALVVPLVPAGLFEPGAPVALDRFVWVPDAPSSTLFGTEDGRGFLNFLFEGLTSGGRNGAAVGVIALILIVGGSFALVSATGAVDRGLMALVARTGDRPAWLLGSLFVAFSLGGAVFGMGEETIAFIVLLLPLVDRLGLPRECAVMATYLASQVGFATSWMNPFSVLVAQGIAGVPPLSGAPFRVAMWATFTAVGVVFTVLYARRHRRQPAPGQAAVAAPAPTPMNWADRLILLGLLATVVWIVWGVTERQYYLPELSAQFFGLGLFAAIVAWLDRRMSANRLAQTFTDGVKQLVPVALVIAAAKGMLWLLGGADPHQPSVLNTLLYGMGLALDGWPTWAAAQGMLLFQSIFNFFVTSGSAQAAITMPLMAGLGDLLQVSRQVSVLAFQLGDGLTNLVVPTSAVLMGAIGVAGIGWSQWLRIIWRLELLFLAMASAAVAVAVGIGYV